VAKKSSRFARIRRVFCVLVADSILSLDRSYETLAVSLRDFVNKATQDPKKFPTPVVLVNNFQHYYIWQFPIVNPVSSKVDKFLNVLTNMGDARTNGMTVKVQIFFSPFNSIYAKLIIYI
jgi:hypothetical protein